MSSEKLPNQFVKISDEYTDLLTAVENLGVAAKMSGPIDEKQAQLIQLAAAASIRSEGAVHSHTRRAMKAGANREEVHHTLLLLTSTIGFPTVAAALSWADDVIP